MIAGAERTEGRACQECRDPAAQFNAIEHRGESGGLSLDPGTLLNGQLAAVEPHSSGLALYRHWTPLPRSALHPVGDLSCSTELLASFMKSQLDP